MRNTLIFLFYLFAQVRSKCLDGFSVSNYSSTTVSLSWEYSCSADDIETYKVDYVHKNYKSCSDGRRDKSKPSGFGTAEVLEPRVVIQNLHPYSEYSFEVRVIIKGRNGRPESKTVIASTDYSIPKVKAQPSSLDYSYKNTDTKLVFNWSPPLESSQCNLYNSELGSFLYQLQGTSEWNRRFFKEDSLKISETLVEIDGLEPYSDYLFLLFISNTENEYDEDVYLRLEGRTLSSEPDPPERLIAEPSDEGTIYFRWRPRNPKKGEISHYEVRIKLTEGKDWLDSVLVDPNDSLCRDDEVYEETVCHTLSDLKPENYTLQVRTYNVKVDSPSAWSLAVHSQALDIAEPQFGLYHILIISGLSILVLVISSVLISKYLENRRKKGFDRVQTAEYSRPIIKSNSYIIRPGSTPGTNSRSVQDPLPPLPQPENIYADLTPKLEEEDNYLKPNPARVDSVESLDEGGYLRPNFNRFQRLDTTCSDPETSPPLIPPVSYLSGNN